MSVMGSVACPSVHSMERHFAYLASTVSHILEVHVCTISPLLGRYIRIEHSLRGYAFLTLRTNNAAGQCVIRGYTTYEACVFSPYKNEFGFEWTWQFNWRTPAYNDELSCSAGFCYPYEGYNQTTCEATPWCTVECDYGPCANKSDCEAAGMCTDTTDLSNPYLKFINNTGYYMYA